MTKSITDNHKKARPRGRPKTSGTTPMTGVRLPEALEAAVLKWARLQEGKTSKAEAIRRLLVQALASSVAEHPTNARTARKAVHLAARELKPLGDKSLPAEEQRQRRRRLIRGPKEFRGIRADQRKSKS